MEVDDIVQIFFSEDFRIFFRKLWENIIPRRIIFKGSKKRKTYRISYYCIFFMCSKTISNTRVANTSNFFGDD
ncbi:hypothetical protein C4Q31_08595 [Leptospira borgpetersenii serovar Ceylonica]|uniref:Uncharacterized protein n=1 Tax=Leptospira borgpetersenii serovar Ballum TaxID=280505 RepID=A0A0E3B8W9_LEPBO|nr:hypothetical protein LBBP_00842 [Leptospira borgpetersenii serovar Ballum]AXX15589.1 hypothetical protein C4Q31_08595 [Leptospira borgpetersenii serovar Ceylonica]EKQ98272.1 hypothetical protein LEP1GSC121_3432 [Leptospira borgpetersenii serovar Castellonis str. 200801910]EMO09922.1 hypothetical protein LEP1GSC137_1827 [Leptospira borgpetersenii str. Noumea 25]KGE24594.1 hypothetical protein IQ66_07380 [Leptospira borgpetersenii serovar Ballum]